MSLFGEALRSRREELRLGQDQLAAALGVRQQTISRWEKGLALPRPARVVTLAAVLALDCAYLHRLTGYLPRVEGPALAEPWQQLYERMTTLTRAELMLLLDRAWEELRLREGLHRPGAR